MLRAVVSAGWNPSSPQYTPRWWAGLGMSDGRIGVLHKRFETCPTRMGGGKDVTPTESAMPKTTTLPWA